MVASPAPQKNLTPKKRSMRSRTIDCRSALLPLDEITPAVVPTLPPTVNGDLKEVGPVPVSVPAKRKDVAPPPALVEDHKLEPVLPATPPPAMEPVPEPEVLPPAPVPVSVISVAPAIPSHLPPRSATPTSTQHETNCSSLLEEQNSSNMNNNTSSGFHSLAQSEQPVTSTAPPSEEPTPVEPPQEVTTSVKEPERKCP